MRRSLPRRVVALVAAYLIALSGLVAAFGGAASAAAEVAGAVTPICHNATADQTAPATGDVPDKTCWDCCCIGCVMLPAALPAAPAAAIVVRHASAPPDYAASLPVLGSSARTNAHRSRAPPMTA